ncbi:hypothetical protein AX16_000429 [Volvariella volvacea WC 439]|nr:hypothetical protein AX16_000429 [Volvariella volvacea WC 439]
MSSTLSPRNESSSRTWWSLSPKSSSSHTSKDVTKTFPEKPTPAKSPSSLKLNSFASAIGLKSKKHPTLTIQDPVPFIQSPAKPTSYNRPPSKSVSSVRSQGDSIGPRTPTDGQRDPPNSRHSLLTLSDTDPFAPRAIVTPASYASSDPNRLSAYSSNSDYGSKKNEVSSANRGSYASTSSASHNFSSINGEVFPLPPSSSHVPDIPRVRRLTTQKSTSSLNRKASMMDNIPTIATAWESIPKSESSTTLTEKPRLRTMSGLQHSISMASIRPPTRPRGMTEGHIQYSEAINDGTNSTPVEVNQRYPPAPRVVIRQASSSRLGQPPSAPPSHGLPPPPKTFTPVDEERDNPILASASSSSSSLSFATSVSSAMEDIQPRKHKSGNKSKESTGRARSPLLEVERGYLPSPEQPTRLASPVAPRTLKKAVSHQVLAKRTLPPQTALPSPPKPHVAVKTQPKERHFPPPRLTLPLRPTALVHASSGEGPMPPDQRRESGNSSTSNTRKRLFSGTSLRRPSTSNTIMSDNDIQSIFSSPSEIELQHSHASFWDEGPSIEQPPPSPPPESIDYTPQQIMSPAEIANFERSVEEKGKHTRQRGLSILSTSTMASTIASTMASEREDELPSPLSLSPPVKLSSLPMRLSTISSNTCFSSTSATSPLSIRSSPAAASAFTSPLIADSPLPASPITPTPDTINAPSTAHDNAMENATTNNRNDVSSPFIPLNSLPPPPRRRPATTESATNPVLRVATDALSPLTPPPRRTNSTISAHASLSPSRVRPKGSTVSMGKKQHRMSIFRKPSFLEIDDDDDDPVANADASSTAVKRVNSVVEKDRPIVKSGAPASWTTAKIQDSFLDLARESFDSVRN